MAESEIRPRKSILKLSAHVLSRTLGIVAVLVITFMMIAIVADVAQRNITGKPIPGVTEMGEVLMVMSVFFGIAFAESKDAHVKVTLLIEKLSPRAAAVINSLGLALVLALVAWMVWLTTGRALEAIEANEVRFGLVKIPVWPARVAIVVGLAAYFLEAVPRLFGGLKEALTGNSNSSHTHELTLEERDGKS